MNADNPAAAASASALRIRQLIAEIERRGAHALLIEIPLSPEMYETRSFRVTRTIVHDTFPDRSAWLRLNAPLSELRWADGAHLDERSALIVVRAIERALTERVER